MAKLRLSYSQRGRIRKCLFYHKLYDLLKVRKRWRPSYFAMGTAMHEGIRAFYLGLPTDPVPDRIYSEELDLSRMDAQALNKIELEKAKLHGMIKGYMKHYASDLALFPKMAHEQEAEIPIDIPREWMEGTDVDRVTFYGKIDCLLMDQEGNWWIKETKTTGDDIDDFIAQARFNAQVMSYMFLAKSVIGHWPKGVIYDVIKKTTHSQKQKESKRQFAHRMFKMYSEEGADAGLFRRSQILIGKRDLEVWRRETHYEVEDTLDAYRRKRFPMNFEQCRGRWGVCDMFPICSTGKINKQQYQIGS